MADEYVDPNFGTGLMKLSNACRSWYWNYSKA
ncbi:hypothetical protein NWP96_03905 [Mycoplasmopsis cynos]|nr:hypothetical protein [Mycoplasmopsis cynos]